MKGALTGCLAALVALTLHGGCGRNSDQGLSFVEHSDSAAATDSSDSGNDLATLKSRLEIYREKNLNSTLLVLPLRNFAGDARLNWLVENVPETLLGRLEALDHSFQAYIITLGDYYRVLSKTGIPSNTLDIKEIAQAVVSEYNVDYLLYGDIEKDESGYVIAPVLISFKDGQPVYEKMKTLQVRNIMSLVNPLASELCEMIDGRSR